MATNKNALIRYKILDNCFRNPGKRYFIKDLMIACESVLFEIDSESNGISRRQIFDDIAFMESDEGWNIELLRLRDGKKVFYRYVEPSFSINNMPLNEIEINQLKDAIHILSQFKGMPQFECVNELVPKLMQGFLSEEATTPIMDFDSNQYLKGIKNLGFLHNAIFYKKVLSIKYQPFENDKPFELIVHPYYLKQYNNRWFLFGYNPEIGKYDWNLALDRIVSLEEIEGEYNQNTDIDWQEYFEDIIGVTKPMNAEVENVEIHFFGKTGHYIETKPLHGSQKSKWLGEKLFEVRLKVMVNYELEKMVLSFGESVVVIKPASLVESIMGKLGKALGNY